MKPDDPLPAGWMARELRRAAMEYRAVEFAKRHPELVNKLADKMQFKAPEPQL